MYVQISGDGSSVGSIQSGVAISADSADTTVDISLTTLDGVSTGLGGRLDIPENGQVAKFLNEFPGFESLRGGFSGILRVSSRQCCISVVGLRGRYNERHDFPITTSAVANEKLPASTADLFFPQIVVGGGYTTEIILMSGSSGQTIIGATRLFSQSGQALNIATPSKPSP